MAEREEDVLPPEVRAEVDKIKQEEGGEEGAPETERVEVAPPERPLSRRARAEEDRKAEIQAANERAAAAAKIAEDVRAQLAERDMADAERWGRLEGMLAQRQQPQPVQEQPKPDKGPDPDKYNRQMTKAKDALAKGDIDEYHRRIEKALLQKAKEQIAPELAARIPQAQQAPMQKPMWVVAVENQFPDVVQHPRGLNAVAAFAQMAGGQLTPESLQAAYVRARQEIGGGAGNPQRERQKDMMRGGSVNGNGGGNRGGNGGGRTVNVPKNWREIARGAGMSEQDYLRSYAQMNPGEVSRE